MTREALEPFRVPGPMQQPAPLPYLAQHGANNYDIALEVGLRSAAMNDAVTICAHQLQIHVLVVSAAACCITPPVGCAMSVGDLLGSGTVSGPGPDQRGSLLEISWNGTTPFPLPGGETRTFLEDGDSSRYAALPERRPAHRLRRG